MKGSHARGRGGVLWIRKHGTHWVHMKGLIRGIRFHNAGCNPPHLNVGYPQAREEAVCNLWISAHAPFWGKGPESPRLRERGLAGGAAWVQGLNRA